VAGRSRGWTLTSQLDKSTWQGPPSIPREAVSPKAGFCRDKILFPWSIDFRFGRFATFPVKKVFFVNQILSGLGETASLGITGGPTWQVNLTLWNVPNTISMNLDQNPKHKRRFICDNNSVTRPIRPAQPDNYLTCPLQPTVGLVCRTKMIGTDSISHWSVSEKGFSVSRCRRENVFSWVSPDVTLVGLFQLFVGGLQL